MANVIKFKKSSVAGKIPLIGDLSLGEPAINTTDGKLFIKKSVSGVESIVELGSLDALSYYHELHVDFDFAGATSDGSPAYPYKTIQAAVDAFQLRPLGTSANTCIFIHGKENSVITENVVINSAVNYLYLKAVVAGNIDTSAITVTGSLTISGTSTRVRVEGLCFQTTLGTPALTINGSPGRHNFYNCQFQGGGVSFTGSYSNFFEFVDCTVTGPLSIAGTPAANTLISFYRFRGASCALTVNAANAFVPMYDTYGLYSVAHQAGTLAITGLWGWGAGSFTSTASAGLLSLCDVSMLKSDYTYGAINKTGSCYYLLNNVQRNEAVDTLSGTRVAYGATSADAKYLPVDNSKWSVAPANVKAALDNLADTRASKTYVDGLLVQLDGGLF